MRDPSSEPAEPPIPVASDPRWTLPQWDLFIQEKVLQYGPRSVMSTDGGHNNVDLVVETRP